MQHETHFPGLHESISRTHFAGTALGLKRKREKQQDSHCGTRHNGCRNSMQDYSRETMNHGLCKSGLL